MRRLTLLGIALLTLAGAARARSAAFQAPSPPPKSAGIPSHSVAEVCERLSAGGEFRVTPAAQLVEQRVFWTVRPGRTPLGYASALAELLGARLLRENTGTPARYRLQRGLASYQNQDRAFGRLLAQAVARSLTTDSLRPLHPEASEAARVRRERLETMRGLARKYLQGLPPDPIPVLLQEEPVPVRADVLTEDERFTLLSSFDDPEHPQRDPVKVRESAQKMETVWVRLVMMFLDTAAPHLELRFRQSGPSNAIALANFTEDELGFPATRSDPYRWMAGTAGAPPSRLAADLEKPLPAEFRLPDDGRWYSALKELCRLAGVDGFSDDYLCRSQSFRQGGGEVLAPQGTKLGDALDALSRKFGYLWWTGTDCLLFRSRTWPIQERYEPPASLVSRLSAVLAAGRPLSPADLAPLAALGPQQSLGLMRYRNTLREGTGWIDGSRITGFCKLLGRLSPAQQADLFRKGLTVSTEITADFPPLQRGDPPDRSTVRVKVEPEAREDPSGYGWHVFYTLQRPDSRTGEWRRSIAVDFCLPRIAPLEL